MSDANDKTDIGAAAAHWWRTALADTGPGRMARARLRRCNTPVEALAVEATHNLHAALGGGMKRQGDRLALIAIALANIRESHARPAAERMGDIVAEQKRPKVSPVRFQTLVRTGKPAELIRPLRRALIQIDQAANVAALSRDLFYWGEATRNRWCFAYYGAASTAPETAEEFKE